MANERLLVMLREIGVEVKRTVQRPASYIFLASLVFLGYQVYLLQNSFSALYSIALTATSRWQATGSVWNLMWLTSESSGEVGLLLRFAGACFFAATAWVLFRKQQLSVSIVRKAVLPEAAYFLLYLPFVVYLLVRPSSSATGFEAGLSYALQMVLVSPSLFMLYRKLRKFEQGNKEVFKWFAIAVCSYIFALWVKGFLFALYAVGIDFSTPTLTIGSVNSVATLLLAGFGSLAICLPVIRGKREYFSWRWVGAVLFCVGAYFVVFDLVSMVNDVYLNWVGLTEWWAASFIVPGVALVARGKLT
jgi:hypothetical protein